MNSSASPAYNDRVAGRYMNDALVERDPETVDQLIARVLRRAHRRADTLNGPNDARAILHLADAFADELATANPRFDRLRFIKDAIDDPS